MPEEDAAARLNQARKADQNSPAKAETEEDKDTQQSQISSAEFLLVGLIALTKDALDIFLTISIVGIPLMFLFSIPMAGFLWLWCVLRFKKTPHMKLAGATVIEFFLGFLPVWTFLVLYLWLEQNGFLPKWLTRFGKTKNVNI